MDSKFSQVSRTFLSIMADLNNAEVLIVSIRPPKFNTSSPLSETLGIVTSAPITSGFTVTLLFYSFLSS